MSRKTHRITAAAIVATLGLSFASAEVSGALAQASEQGDEANGGMTGADSALAPIFISEEVVQPVPGESSEDTTDSQENADREIPVSLRELVSRVDTGSDLSEQMQCLASAVYFESRGEPLIGQLAVAQVIINRAESNSFPESYCDVVYQRAQFSFVKNGSMPRIRTGSEAWQRAKSIARIAHEGMWDSEASDSLYFHAKYVRPNWSRKKIARATISQHVFYR